MKLLKLSSVKVHFETKRQGETQVFYLIRTQLFKICCTHTKTSILIMTSMFLF